ncbi:hypothetical protein [Lactiplantibacillus pentosus]|jgi:hypothetical protein|nr:hypothetical protein [Lactiplantibacillus pentosus]USJ87437.1 hypothetical protein KSF55_06395 [Lactiplantibacillus pentosus]
MADKRPPIWVQLTTEHQMTGPSGNVQSVAMTIDGTQVPRKVPEYY